MQKKNRVVFQNDNSEKGVPTPNNEEVSPKPIQRAVIEELNFDNPNIQPGEESDDSFYEKQNVKYELTDGDLDPDDDELDFLRKNLDFEEREEFRKKHSQQFVTNLRKNYDRKYIVKHFPKEHPRDRADIVDKEELRKKRGQSVPHLKKPKVPLKYDLNHIHKEFFRNMVKESLEPSNNVKLKRDFKTDYKVDDSILTKINSAEEHNIKVRKLFANSHTAEDFKLMGTRADRLANTFKTKVEKLINEKGEWYEMIKQRGPLLDIDYSAIDEIDLYMYPSPDMRANETFRTSKLRTINQTEKKEKPR